MQRAPKQYIEDIVNAISMIEQYTMDMTSESFARNMLVKDAVLRNMEVISEAANHIDQFIKAQYPEINWQRLTGWRMLLIQTYFSLDYDDIWEIINEEILKAKLKFMRILIELSEIS